GARQVMSLVPSVPPGEMVQAAYTGHDVFGGSAGAQERSYLGLWGAALPSLGLMLAWIVLLALAVRRFFRWDPRQPWTPNRWCTGGGTKVVRPSPCVG